MTYEEYLIKNHKIKDRERPYCLRWVKYYNEYVTKNDLVLNSIDSIEKFLNIFSGMIYHCLRPIKRYPAAFLMLRNLLS